MKNFMHLQRLYI